MNSTGKTQQEQDLWSKRAYGPWQWARVFSGENPGMDYGLWTVGVGVGVDARVFSGENPGAHAHAHAHGPRPRPSSIVHARVFSITQNQPRHVTKTHESPGSSTSLGSLLRRYPYSTLLNSRVVRLSKIQSK